MINYFSIIILKQKYMFDKIKLVVFDMAGTTVDEQNIVYKTLHKSIKKASIDVSLKQVLTHAAGKEKYKAIVDTISAVNPNIEIKEIATKIFIDFQKELDKAYENLDVKTFKGVLELFSLLRKKDVKITLNTGYNTRIANLLLNKLGWKKGQEYDYLVSASDVENSRPHPDMILKAMQHFNIKGTANVLKAGDSAIDIEEGKNANCGISVGVLSGAQTKEELLKANPDYILDNLGDLITYFI